MLGKNVRQDRQAYCKMSEAIMVQRLRTQKVAGLAKPITPASRSIKWNRYLQGPGTKYCVIARRAG